MGGRAIALLASTSLSTHFQKLSEMKLSETRLRNILCDETLDEAMMVSIEH